MTKKLTSDRAWHKLRLKPDWCSKRAQPYFVLVVTWLLTAFATNYMTTMAGVKNQLRFDSAAQGISNEIQNHLDTYVTLLRGGSSLFATSDQVSRAQFRAYVNRLDLQHRYPGIQGIGFSMRLRPEERHLLVAKMREQGVENFTLQPKFKRAEEHAIIYLEPLNQRNQAALGFDMFTEPVRRAAMERARDTGASAASGRVSLMQEIDQHKQAGFLIYTPVYCNGSVPNTVAERRAALRGFVYSPFRIDDLFRGIFGSSKQSYIDFQVYDGTAIAPSHLLHHSPGSTTEASYQSRFTTTTRINVAGRSWSIYFASRPEFEQLAQRSLAPYIAATGFLLGCVLFSVMRSQNLAWQQVQRLNADLEDQVQERTAKLQQSLEFEATLKRITDKVRDGLDEGQLLQAAMQELVLTLEIICCDTASYNLDQRTSTIRYEYHVSSNEGISRNSTTPSSVGLTVQMASFPEAYNLLLQGQYLQFCEITSDHLRSQMAILACPIVDERGVLGDLWLFKIKEDTFDELEIRLVQQVSNQCAIALRQARLYQAATAQVEELERLNSLKNDFLSTVSHELRTPLANMKMAIQMLKNCPTQERCQRYLEILQVECTREVELINDLLDLQRLETASCPDLLAESVDLPVWLPTFIKPFHIRTEQRHQKLQVHLPLDPPTLVSDRFSLERILAELLNNACKYTAKGGEIVFSVDYKSAAAATLFIISNSTEIPAAELPRIFKKFYRVPKTDPWKQGGTGLGLALVQKLVERLEGTIFVESSRGWTTFTVQLPNQSKV